MAVPRWKHVRRRVFTYLGLRETATKVTSQGTNKVTRSDHVGLQRVHLMRLQEAERSTIVAMQTERAVSLLFLMEESRDHVASEQDTHFG